MKIFRIVCLLSFFVFGGSFVSYAQSYKAYMKAGEKATRLNDYYAAMQHYLEALTKKPKSVEAQFKYAEVARQFNSFEESIKYYKKVIKHKEGKQYPLAAFHLGTVLKQMGEYEKAKSAFQDYLGSANEANYSAKAKAEIETCDWALEMAKEPQDYKVEQLNKRINTPYSEFGAIQRGDTLFYSSFRFTYKKDKVAPKRKFTKVLYSRKGSKGRTMKRSFNVDSVHTAHTTFSLNGQRIYFTKCRYVNGVEIRCELYYRDKDRRKRWNKKAKKLSKDINMMGFTATHPTIGYDSTMKKEVLYFVSDRPGGEGGLDIWFATLNKDGKTFSRPTNLEGINTKGDDLTPFFHTATQTLYFSSDGYAGLGGYDVFKSKRDFQWGEVQNIGAPLNSSYNDVYFFMAEDEKIGYLSSNRLGSFYLDKENKTCCNDIYKFTYIEPEPLEQDTTTTVVEPVLPVPDPVVEIEKEPETLEDFLPLALYFDNDEPDRRTRRTTTKKAYGDTFDKYIKRKSTYIKEYIQPVEEEDKATSEEFMDGFFEDEVRKGHRHLYLFSEILLKRLKEGEKVEIFIKGFTSPRAKSDYNLALGKRRVSSLRNHFDEYQDGIFQSYIRSGKLVITERSFGEATASADVSDELEDQRNSIYSVSAARERRVEIVEIKRGE